MTSAHATAHGSHETGAQGEVHPHVMSPKVLLTVYFILVLATIATVAVTLVDMDAWKVGPLNIWAALAIAVFKASLVILYFMHVRYEKPFNGVILISALVFVMVFVAMALLDTSEYKMNYQAPGTRQMMSSQDGV